MARHGKASNGIGAVRAQITGVHFSWRMRTPVNRLTSSDRLRSPHRPLSATEDGDQSRRMPYLSETWTFWPRKEAAGVADAMIKAEPPLLHRDMAGDLHHPLGIGMGRHARATDLPAVKVHETQDIV